MDEQKMIEHIASSEQDIKSIHRRLDNLENLVETIHILANEMKATRESVNNLDERISNVENRPVRRYETFITATITAVVGVLVGILMRGGF